jgi:hypothetical protein
MYAKMLILSSLFPSYLESEVLKWSVNMRK